MLPVAGTGLLFLSLWFRADAPRVFAGVNDFLGIYAGARFVGTPEQFNAEAHIREQVHATQWSAPSILYTRLPAFALLLRPLGKLEYLRAYAWWQALSLAALAAFLMAWPTSDRSLLLLGACWSFPLFADIAGGQDIAFLLVILAIVWRLNAKWPLAAGSVLALCALKFHLFLLVPVFLTAQRRWRMMAGAAATASVLLGLCFSAAGANWLPQYARFILQGQTNPGVRSMPNLHGLLDGLPNVLAWEAGGALVVATAVWWVAQRTSFSVGLSTALVGSQLTSHHGYPADLLLLLPALLTLAAELPSVPLRAICLLLLSPLPFLVKPLVPLAEPAPLLLVAVLIAVTAAVGTSARHADRRALAHAESS
jgi:hypothetical protein